MAEKSNVPYDTISRMSVSSQSIFSKCCFCVPLRLGCFILGYLNLTVNCFQTIILIGVTTLIGAASHGFHHFDDKSIIGAVIARVTAPDDMDKDTVLKVDPDTLTQIGFVLAILLLATVSWLAINIACLVGLHKKRPGPIRVYVGFATARLVVSLAGFIYLVMNSKLPSQSIVAHAIDIGLSGYFILVYYIYSMRLERERKEEADAPAIPVKNLYYPELEKSHFVA